jgi:hypothetical protein
MPLALQPEAKTSAPTALINVSGELSFLARFFLGGLLCRWPLASAATTAGITLSRSKQNC